MGLYIWIRRAWGCQTWVRALQMQVVEYILGRCRFYWFYGPSERITWDSQRTRAMRLGVALLAFSSHFAVRRSTRVFRKISRRAVSRIHSYTHTHTHTHHIFGANWVFSTHGHTTAHPYTHTYSAVRPHEWKENSESPSRAPLKRRPFIRLEYW